VIDREVYFDAVRETLFAGALTQQQVDGQNILLSLWEHEGTGSPMDDVRWLGYCLASVYWETGTKMWPVRETGQGVGKDYGIVDPETGNVFYGRGLVQLTWKDNYRKASAALGLIEDRDLLWYPDLALDSLVSARILFRGMAEGWFTGKRLNDYFSDLQHDPVNARKIVNGLDHAEDIAACFDAFMAALDEAAISVEEWDKRQRQEPVTLTVPIGTRVIVNGLVVEP
jgi:putative chitinase